jgi:hypothetical protein
MGQNRPDNRDLDAVLATFETRDFRNWHGLVPCTIDDLTARYKLTVPGASNGRLGRAWKPMQYSMLDVSGYIEPVSVWFNERRVVLLEAEYPEVVPNVAATLQALGTPDARLDVHWRSLKLVHGQLVYASRGLALYINPENQVLLRLAAFEPTSIDIYNDQLMLDLGEKRYGDGLIS